MSTLAATKADGFYYPPVRISPRSRVAQRRISLNLALLSSLSLSLQRLPRVTDDWFSFQLSPHEQDWTPEGGAKSSAFKGSKGSLGKRGNKMSQGVLTIRFEMPYDVRCGACGHTIGKGVRFNAEKRKIGNYHSTPIWSFTMHSACCAQEIEVHTDPANTEYNVVKGAERCVRSGQVDDEAEEDMMRALEYQNDQERERSRSNPLSALEHSLEDEKRARASSRMMFDLKNASTARWKEDYNTNKSLRRSMRGQRKEENALKEYSRSIGLPDHVKLKPERDEDKEYAKRVYNSHVFDRRRREKRKQIFSEDIFAKSSKPGQPAISSTRRKTGTSSVQSRAAKLAKRR